MINDRTRKYLITALMSAVIMILSPFSIAIPISPVPISLSTLTIYLASYILGSKYAAISTMLYVLLGIIGLPVFTGFTGGVAKVLGPTGGYIISYVFLAIIAGSVIEKNYDNKVICFLGMLLGTIVLYIVGSLWLAFVMRISFRAALFAGVIPFIPGDIVKMIVALFLGDRIRIILKKLNYL